MSLHFVVLSFDRYSRDDVIGEVILPLNDAELSQIESQQVALCKEIQPRSLKVRETFISWKTNGTEKSKMKYFFEILNKSYNLISKM